MKLVYTLLLLITSFSFNSTYGQELNGLIFNQVLLVSLTDGLSVPNNKVWKVVSAVATQPNAPSMNFNWNNNSGQSLSQNTTTYFNVDGAPFELYKGTYIGTKVGNQSQDGCTSAYGAATFTSNLLPLWLPSGTSLTSGANVSKLSVFEYDIDEN